jgi:hypothetical protein
LTIAISRAIGALVHLLEMGVALFQKRGLLGHGPHHRLEHVDIIGKGGIMGRHCPHQSMAEQPVEVDPRL